MVADIFINRYDVEKGRVFGVMSLNGSALCHTLEKFSRIIPPGTYELVLNLSPKFGRYMWYLKDVPRRVGIMIHAGNTLKDTNGCILVGERDGLNLINSRSTLANLDEVLKGYDRVTLTITK